MKLYILNELIEPDAGQLTLQQYQLRDMEVCGVKKQKEFQYITQRTIN